LRLCARDRRLVCSVTAPIQRDRMIDGYRGVAVLGVIVGHALAYHYSVPHLLGRLAGPAAGMGVQLFFAISGYIITSLLLKEDHEVGSVSIPAFYIRRCFRILPPLFIYYLSLVVFHAFGAIQFAPRSIASSAAFTCNTGLTECDWFVAHTWSLAVEEQYYLVWPLLFTLLSRRALFLAVAVALMLGSFLVLPLQPNSNWIAFSSIAAGALYAASTRVRNVLTAVSSYWLFAAAVIAFSAINLYPMHALFACTPALILLILFAPRQLPLIRSLLESSTLNAIGLVSYSLYLWQQLFLARPERYFVHLPLAALPILVALSYFLVEKPFSRLGRVASEAVRRSIARESKYPENEWVRSRRYL